MATSIRLRGGTTSQHSTFTGAAKEVTVDTDKNTIVVHDGTTAGGFPLLAKDASGNVTFADDDVLKFGAGSDLEILHNSANNNSIIRELGSGLLSIQTNGTAVTFYDSSNAVQMGAFNTGGSVDLSYAGTTRFATTSVGADVTGEFIADSYNETYAAVTSTTNATTVDCEAGNAFSHTLTENTTFTFSNPPASGTAYTFSLEIIQDASASGYTVTFPAAVDWPSATAPTLTATADARDVFVFYTRDGGTTWLGFTAGQALG